MINRGYYVPPERSVITFDENLKKNAKIERKNYYYCDEVNKREKFLRVNR